MLRDLQQHLSDLFISKMLELTYDLRAPNHRAAHGTTMCCLTSCVRAQLSGRAAAVARLLVALYEWMKVSHEHYAHACPTHFSTNGPQSADSDTSLHDLLAGAHGRREAVLKAGVLGNSQIERQFAFERGLAGER